MSQKGRHPLQTMASPETVLIHHGRQTHIGGVVKPGVSPVAAALKKKKKKKTVS